MEHNLVEYLINCCIDSSRQKVLVIYDETTLFLVEIFRKALIDGGKTPEVVKINVASCHGEEPSGIIVEKMLNSHAIICLTKYSLAHTKARKQAENKKVSFLSMPEYDIELLNNCAMQVDYASKVTQVERYAEFLTKGKKVHIETESGTNMYLNIENRIGNACPGLTNDKYLLGSPPDIEANIAPIETDTKGHLVIDGSITDRRIGLLSDPVILDVEDGLVKKIYSKNKEIEKKTKHILGNVGSEKAYVVAELGIGFNDCAKLCGNMLIDEGAKGCIHFGLGSNWTIGGQNSINFHLDFVLRNATITVDDKMIIAKGEMLYAD